MTHRGEIVWSRTATRDRIVSEVPIDCRKCAMCRASSAADWKTRLCCEALMWRSTAVVTLTVSDEHLDRVGSVHKRDGQLFMKRLRFAVAARGGEPLRYCLQAEYSPELLRPHWHGLLFNYDPPDGERWNRSRAGNQQWRSEELSKAWGLGFVTYQLWSEAGAGYVAGHDSGKVLNPDVSGPVFGPEGVCVGERERECCLRSSKPGIGGAFFDRYHGQMLHNGWTVCDGRKVPLGKYFLERGKGFDEARVEALKAEYMAQVLSRAADATPERLAVREVCALDRAKRLRRDGVE